MARPEKDIDAEEVEKLAAIDCSYAEIASFVGCDPKTLTNRFSQVIENGRAKGNASLKRKMWKAAVEDGNITMMIWLSKQRFGYADKVEQTHTGHIGQVPPISEEEHLRIVSDPEEAQHWRKIAQIRNAKAQAAAANPPASAGKGEKNEDSQPSSAQG